MWRSPVRKNFFEKFDYGWCKTSFRKRLRVEVNSECHLESKGHMLMPVWFLIEIFVPNSISSCLERSDSIGISCSKMHSKYGTRCGTCSVPGRGGKYYLAASSCMKQLKTLGPHLVYARMEMGTQFQLDLQPSLLLSVIVLQEWNRIRKVSLSISFLSVSLSLN